MKKKIIFKKRSNFDTSKPSVNRIKTIYSFLFSLRTKQKQIAERKNTTN